MFISSPQHFLALKSKNALFAIGGRFDYGKSKSIIRIENYLSDRWKLFIEEECIDMASDKNIVEKHEEIVYKTDFTVWHLSRRSWNGNIPSIFSGKSLKIHDMYVLREKMRLVGEELDFLHEDFITGQSIKLDMGIQGKILTNIYNFYLRSFLSRISTGIYKLTESPIRKRNTSLTDILEFIELLDILDDENKSRLENDLDFCLNANKKIGAHSRNILIGHMDFESHNSLSVVDESRGTIQISGVRVDNDWLEDIKKLLKIHEYWLSYIFSISYGPNISQPHNPQELEEYEYKLFLTVIDKGSGEEIQFNE